MKQEQEAKQDDSVQETSDQAAGEESETLDDELQVEEQDELEERQAGDEEDERVSDEIMLPVQVEEQAFDWFALGVVIIAGAIFALASRMNAQPPTSLVPAAVLSATGCGLLVTGLRKVRTARRPGLLEAGLGGFVLALCQFLAALSYPGIVPTLVATPDERTGFLATWALVAILSVIFSLGGAALGHLAFAPLRPAPPKKTAHTAEKDVETEEAARPRSWFSYATAVFLLGLVPTLAGYVFAAAFDYTLGLYHFLLGPYPTLRLLGALLPWQVPIPFDPGNSANAALVRLVELWRIPALLGNPTLFDFQALEPYAFTGAGLALLLLTLRDESGQRIAFPRAFYFLLEALLGLLLVIPADLWIMRGLEGLLRSPLFSIPLRTLYVLDNLTFALNIVTGPVVCLIVSVGLRVIFNRLTNGPAAQDEQRQRAQDTKHAEQEADTSIG